ncbi:hypothetical protein AB0L14_37375 [Streptomyces sp. NPDC052727]|uniref:hypothetical protein n=1 Tax=Streptomyces sp. NPDC052727 TaxID=3154854 RepID=UPI0034140483
MDDFVFVSGRLSLDLAGTLLWRRSRRIELLCCPDDLRRWSTRPDCSTRPVHWTPAPCRGRAVSGKLCTR